MANAFVHMELNTQDLGKAKEFYSKLFDWKLETMPGPMEYVMIAPGEGPGGGMMQHPVPGAPSMWLTYVGVDDVKAATDKAKSLGATALQENHEVPNYGWFSILSDPAGAVFALWQPKK
jgi:predicted enzyme related to lactoylglutathione lyase